MLRVVTRNLGQSYRRPTGLLMQLLAQASGQTVCLVSKRADLEVGGVQFPPLSRFIRQARSTLSGRSINASVAASSPRGDTTSSLWVTGENVRPPLGPWGGFLSFEVDDLLGRNAYMPIWFEHVGLFGDAHPRFLGRAPRIDELLALREPTAQDRPRDVCAFIGNPEPLRLRAIEALAQVLDVEVFGSSVGRPVRDKLSAAASFKFMLCFENDIYPGYVTEKPIDAWAAGCIPIWSGIDPAAYLNTGAMIRYSPDAGIESLVERVMIMAHSRCELAAMSAQPILLKEPDLEPCLRVIRSALGV